MRYLNKFNESIDTIKDNIYGILVELEDKGFIYDIRDIKEHSLSIWIGIDTEDISDEEIEDYDTNYFEKEDLDDIDDNIKHLNDYMNFKNKSLKIKYGYFNFHDMDKERDSFVYFNSIDEIFEKVWQIDGLKIKYIW